MKPYLDEKKAGSKKSCDGEETHVVLGYMQRRAAKWQLMSSRGPFLTYIPMRASLFPLTNEHIPESCFPLIRLHQPAAGSMTSANTAGVAMANDPRNTCGVSPTRPLSSCFPRRQPRRKDGKKVGAECADTVYVQRVPASSNYTQIGSVAVLSNIDTLRYHLHGYLPKSSHRNLVYYLD